MTQTITLEGFLGKDPEIRETPDRTVTLSYDFRDPILDGELVERETDVIRRGREFAFLSLATHQGKETVWHRLVVWNLPHPSTVRFVRKGDRVRVTGRPEVYRFTDATGAEREIQQVVVETFHLLRRKVCIEVP